MVGLAWLVIEDRHEIYEGILERVLLAVVSALDDSGVKDAVVTSPQSAAEQRTVWDPSADGGFVDDWDE